MRAKPELSLLMLAAFSWVLPGCVLGPAAVRLSREPYNEAIRRTTAEQLLLNLVRLRYRESPLFLEIGSVAAQFNFTGSANAQGTFVEDDAYSGTNNPESLEVGGQFGYEERPTVTFQPLQGDEFVKRLLTPVDLDTIVLLTYSGWNVDRVLRLTVRAMNGLDNASRASGPTPAQAPEYESFARVARLLRELQWEGELRIGYESRATELSDALPAQAVSAADVLAAAKAGYRFQTLPDGQAVLTACTPILVMRTPPEATAVPQVREIIDLLRLEPGRASYDIRPAASPGAEPTVSTECRACIDIATRSLLGMLFYLSQAVEAPPAHCRAGLVTTTVDECGQPFDWTEMMGNLLQVHCCAMPPRNAAVAVRYRGYWFYIDDTDLTSKSTFGLLGQLLALQAGSEVKIAPLLTLPIGK
jgi:hypothetical protein